MNKTKKIISRKLIIFIVIVVIIIVVISSFQLYEFDSEPSHQLTLDKNFNKNMEAGCKYNRMGWFLYQNYTETSKSYNARFFMVER
jgi:hypothetical protein